MPSWANYSYAFGPVVGMVGLAVIVLLMRWTFSRGRSLVERRSVPGAPDDYGLLETVAAPATYIEAELLRRRLIEHNIRATLAPTTDGPRVLVFPADAVIARTVLASGSEQR